jgi:uncharacterized phiE125 gp8 family phage protein
MQKLKLFTAPTTEPVTVTEAKAQVRQDSTADDTYIASLIATARQDVEGFINRALVSQTWELYLDAWPCHSYLDLPLPPLQSITSITYVDSSGTTATFASSNYYVDILREPGRVYLKPNASWPAVALQIVNGVIVKFVAGYGAAAAVPDRIKQGILLRVGELYEKREDNVSGIPGFSDAEKLLSKVRIFPRAED